VNPLGRAVATTYLITALIGGAIMAFLSPPFQAPDEPNHFFRAQALSEGYVVAQRQPGKVGAPMRTVIPHWALTLMGDIPGHPDKKQTVDGLKAQRDARADDLSIMFVDFRNSALYSPVVYLPQAAGLGLGRLSRMPLLDAYYLGRLLNLIASVALCYWTALRLPYAQLSFVMLALCPMFLFQQASFSADALTYALAAAFCGAVLKESVHTDTALGRRTVSTLALLGALMGLTKPSAAPLPLFALLLLRRTSGSSHRRPWGAVMVVIGISWATMLGWSSMMSGMYLIANLAPGIDPSGQRAWILAHPWGFVDIVWRTILVYWSPLLHSAVGVLGWLDTALAWRYVKLFYGALIVSGVVAGARTAYPGWAERWLAALLAISTYVLMAVISYLTWTPVGAPLIDGWQGRYFLPLIVPAAVLLQWPAWAQHRISERVQRVVVIGCLVCAELFLIYGFRVMYVRYWA
jgi:uncharacterized membrane protein